MAGTNGAGFDPDALASTLRSVLKPMFDDLKLEVRGVGTKIDGLTGRFDHHLGTAGQEAAELRRDVEELRVRVEALERKPR